MELREACVPQLTTKFGWSVKIKSVQELDWGSRCVGSDISWWKLYKDVSALFCLFFHQDNDLALNSHRIVVNKVLDEAVLHKGCVRYNFACLFFRFKRENLWNKEECFLFHLESSFRSWDNQIVTFQIFDCHDIIKCLSMKHETHFTEQVGK